MSTIVHAPVALPAIRTLALLSDKLVQTYALKLS